MFCADKQRVDQQSSISVLISLNKPVTSVLQMILSGYSAAKIKY